MIKELLSELKKSCFSVLPIYILVLVLMLFKVIALTGNEILSFSLATIFLIIGISLFNYGAEHAMTPIGRMVGKGLTKQGKVFILLVVVFIFGLLITIAEPDLSVLATQTESVFPKLLLIISIGVSVGFFLLLAILKILKKINLIRILSVLYMFAFAMVALLAYQGKENMVALCFDGGGVTGTPSGSYTNATTSTTNTSGVKVVSSATYNRAAVLYNGAVNGWVNKTDNAATEVTALSN